MLVRSDRARRPRRTEPGRVRRVASWVLTALAGLLVWFALAAPVEVTRLTPVVFVRLPLEALVVAAVLLALPPRARTVVAVVVGILLGPLAIVKLLDVGFHAALGRPFDPVVDWVYFDSAKGVLGDSIGGPEATVVVVLVSVVVLAVLVLVPLAVVRLSRVVTARRRTSARVVAVLAVVWVLCAVTGAQLVTGTPVASTSTASAAFEQVRQVGASVRDERQFDHSLASDRYAGTPGTDLLTGLRGKDVLVVFVESYGRVAVQGSTFAPAVDRVLDDGTRRLAAAGFSARSAFLTSPTFGGISWLAHSTLQSGLWVDNQRRYDRLMTSDRFTLATAFERGGWRVVSDIPSDTAHWPQGTSFYHYDALYNSTNVGYRGPRFSYATMPDQYTLSALQRLELAPAPRQPVMAEVDLLSSHTPWAPLPRMVGWDQVGDGSVFAGMPAQGQSPTSVWRHASQVQAAYGQSVQYSLDALISFVTTYPDPNLVMVVLGDHQPATIVSGAGAGHDVPISVVAHDPKVLDRIGSWGWQDGLRPHPDAPVWPMDAFRDRFLTAYGPQQASPAGTAASTTPPTATSRPPVAAPMR